MVFQEITAVSLTDSVVEQIKNMIVKQEIKVGDHLPPERRLCELLGVSRTVIREAVNRLVELGIVIKKPGSGSFVREINRPLRRAMDFLVESGETSMNNIIEIRRTLETEAAALAAQRCGERAKSELYQALLGFETVKGLAEDQQFHLAIANATGNPLFAFVLEALIDLINNMRQRTLSEEEGINLACQTHRGIYQAIIDHDRKRAIEMIRLHLDHAEKILKNSEALRT